MQRALHRANGGYLVVEAEKLLNEPFVWEALKRALHSRQLKMESPLGDLGRIATVTLNPQVIPLQVKVVIIGARQLYYALQDLDSDFQEMFRVLVDFDEDIPMGDESLEQFAQLLKTRTSEEGMAPLTADAVARLEGGGHAHRDEVLLVGVGGDRPDARRHGEGARFRDERRGELKLALRLAVQVDAGGARDERGGEGRRNPAAARGRHVVHHDLKDCGLRVHPERYTFPAESAAECGAWVGRKGGAGGGLAG